MMGMGMPFMEFVDKQPEDGAIGLNQGQYQ